MENQQKLLPLIIVKQIWKMATDHHDGEGHSVTEPRVPHCATGSFCQDATIGAKGIATNGAIKLLGAPGLTTRSNVRYERSYSAHSIQPLGHRTWLEALPKPHRPGDAPQPMARSDLRLDTSSLPHHVTSFLLLLVRHLLLLARHLLLIASCYY